MQKAKTFLKDFSDGFLRVLYPPLCVVCGAASESGLCDVCARSCRALTTGLCSRCGLGAATGCTHCTWMNTLDWIRSSVAYVDAGGMLVRGLKFNRHLTLAEPMAQQMNELLVAAPEHHYLVPVPIHWSREAYRGFNQSALIAEHLKSARIREDLLQRVKRTKPQARLSLAKRKSNLVDAMVAKPLNGERLMLVDDVVTSGSTLEACAHELKRAGASWVGAITFARQNFQSY